jgi:hypothetical protein
VNLQHAPIRCQNLSWACQELSCQSTLQQCATFKLRCTWHASFLDGSYIVQVARVQAATRAGMCVHNCRAPLTQDTDACVLQHRCIQ